MCSEIGSNLLPPYFAVPDWIEALLQEYEDEDSQLKPVSGAAIAFQAKVRAGQILSSLLVGTIDENYSLPVNTRRGISPNEIEKEEARWPTMLLHSVGRKLVWHLSALLGVSSRGVPGNACRLLERYFARHIQSYFEVFRDNDEWQLYRTTLASWYPLLAVSCIQLAAKMTDLTVPLSATSVCSTLFKTGVVHSKAEIVHMEFHVYHTLDFRLPLWTSIEVAQFLAIHVGINNPSMIEAVAYIVDLTEFNRDLLEYRLRCSSEIYNTPGSSSNSSRTIIRTLHMSAGGVCAASRFMRASVDTAHALAALTRTTPTFIKAISDIILESVIPAV